MVERKRSYLRKIIHIQERKQANRNDLENTREGITLQEREGLPSSETDRRRVYSSLYP